MEIVRQSFTILSDINEERICSMLEMYGRTAYKSESKMVLGSSKEFVRNLIKRGHESVLEHYSITVKFITNRGMTHELVRHRIASYTQESTRYCNYSKLGITYCKPTDFELNEEDKTLLKAIENHYNKRMAEGLSPQQARYFLPNGLKTEIICTFNIREWRHVLRLRTDITAHPDIRMMMRGILAVFQDEMYTLFGDIIIEDD